MADGSTAGAAIPRQPNDALTLGELAELAIAIYEERDELPAESRDEAVVHDLIEVIRATYRLGFVDCVFHNEPAA